MTKLLMRCLAALSTVLVLSCGGGGGGSVDGASAGVSTGTNNVVKDSSSPEWGFAGQAGEGGGNAGSASGSGSGTSGSSASGGGAGSGDTASASAGDTGGVGSGGTGASASAGDSGDSGVGGVGGVASIIVNDVRYDTAGAILKLRDASQLQLGMTAKVNGPTNADFTAGQATEVESAADARGVITSIDLGSGNLVVLGMTISTDATTVWGNVSGLGALAPGMTVQVWGLPAGPGLLRATRIEHLAAGTPILSGVVQNLDPANRRFLLGGLTIDFSQATLPPAAMGGGPVRVIARVRETLCCGVAGAASTRGVDLLESGQKKRDDQGRPVRCPLQDARLERSVLELLQRANLELGGGRLGGEPLLFLGERVDALALRLGRHIDGGDLQQARQGERAGALLVHRSGDSAFQRGQHSADVLGDNAGDFSDVCNQARLGQHFLDRLRSGRLGGCLRRDFLHCLLRGSLLSGLCHGFLFRERLVVWSAPNPVGKRNVGQLLGAANSLEC